MEWFQDYPRHQGLKPDESGAEEAAFIRRVLRLRPGDEVLDAPCGAARIAAHLATAGLRVTGVDLTPAYIARAQQRFAQAGLAGDFPVCDLRQIDYEDRFRAVINWQGSFGFFSDAENLDVVRRYARALRRGGRLLIDQPGREYLLRHFRASGASGDTRFKTRWRSETQRVETAFRKTSTGETWAMSIRLYTPAQFSDVFRRAGVEVEATYCDLNARPYVPSARRLYIVGRKP